MNEEVSSFILKGRLQQDHVLEPQRACRDGSLFRETFLYFWERLAATDPKRRSKLKEMLIESCFQLAPLCTGAIPRFREISP